MTDETRPQTPDAETSAPTERNDALDSWFRPAANGEQPAGGAVDAGAAGEASGGESGEEAGDESAEVSAGEASAGDGSAEASAHQVSAGEESADEGGAAEQADESDRADGPEQVEPDGDESGRVEPDQVEPERADRDDEPAAAADESTPADDRTQVMPAVAAESPKSAGDGGSSDDALTQVFPATPPSPAGTPAVGPTGASPVAAAPTQAIPRSSEPDAWTPESAKPGMAVRPATSDPKRGQAGREVSSWRPEPGSQQRQQEYQQARPYRSQPYEQPSKAYERQTQPPAQPQTRPLQAPGGNASILPARAYDDYDDFDSYSYVDPKRRPRSALRRALLTTTGVGVLVIAVVAALAFSGKIKVLGIGGPKPVPTVGFSPSGSDAGSNATQTGTAFLTAWQNGNLKGAANITDNPSAALTQLTAYKKDLKVSGLTLMPGTASAQGWMTFSVTAQVGMPSSAWSYSSGLAAYSANVDGYTRWFVKWQPSVLFTSLKADQKLALGLIPPTANKVVDSTGAEITGANAPSLNGIVGALKKAAPVVGGTPGQQVQIDNADGSVASIVDKVSAPVADSAVKTTINLKLQAAAQSAVNQAPNSSMVVIQPSTGNILAVANNPTNGLDIAMVGHYAPGSTFKTITTTLVLNKHVITDLNQTWDCPATLSADGITLHNSEQEAGVGKSFLWDFAQSCNNAFSRFEGKVSRTDLASTAHDYFGFNQKWDVGLAAPTTYGNVPDTSSNSLAEELVGQDQITTSPLAMASVAATIANGSFKQPILVPGAKQATATPLPSSTDQNLKALMHEVVVSGTLAGVLPAGVYGKTGTAEVQGRKPNSWTIAFKGDYAVAALAVGGGFGASTAGPEVKSLLGAAK